MVHFYIGVLPVWPSDMPILPGGSSPPALPELGSGTIDISVRLITSCNFSNYVFLDYGCESHLSVGGHDGVGPGDDRLGGFAGRALPVDGLHEDHVLRVRTQVLEGVRTIIRG